MSDVVCRPYSALLNTHEIVRQRHCLFFQVEISLHKKQIRNSAEATSALLADEFVEFGSSGRVWNKSSIIESMRREEADDQITIEDFVTTELAPDVVLVTYVSNKTGASTLRSSIWKRFDGK